MEGDGNPSTCQNDGDSEPPMRLGAAPGAQSRQSDVFNKEAGQKQEEKSSKFDRALKTTDVFIAIFTVVSGIAAIVSAASAFYTASQIGSSSRQTDIAINRMADVANATGNEADLMANELIEMRNQTADLSAEASAAEGQLKSSKAQTALARASMVAANRAWVEPTDAHLVGPLGDPAAFVNYFVDYQNTGHSPATQVREGHESGHLPTPDFAQGHDLIVPENRTCKQAAEKRTGWIAYPANGGNYRVYLQLKPLDPTVRTGQSVQYIQGCLVYRTEGETDFSPYCFFLEPNSGLPIDSWQFKNCTTGADANR